MPFDEADKSNWFLRGRLVSVYTTIAFLELFLETGDLSYSLGEATSLEDA